MYSPVIRNMALIAGCAASLTCHAATLSNSDLPGTIQSCVASNSCFVVNSSSYDSGMVSAYTIYDASFNQGLLVRYALVSPSGGSFTDTDYTQDPPVTTSSSTPYAGYLWMYVQNSYSASEAAHPVTLYLDKVSPVPRSLFNQSGDLSLFVTTSDLLAGSSFMNAGLTYDNQSYYFGNLSGETPVPCVAEECNVYAQLNLVQLQFGSFGTAGIYFTGFDPADSRGQIYAQGDSYSGYPGGYGHNYAQSFYISAVPVPEPVWLFSSGLACLVPVVRRRRVTATR